MKTLWLLLCCSFLSFEAAGAAPIKPVETSTLAIDRPMQIKRVRSNDPKCEPKCAEWISAEGKIVPGTAAEFRQMINSLGPQKLPVVIHSGGGAVRDAMAIGRLIRDRQLDVAVGRTEFEPCSEVGCSARPNARGRTVDFHAICASACALLLAGGERRFVAPFAFVGVHQITAFQTKRTLYRTYRVLTRRIGDENITVSKTLVSEREVSRTFKLPHPPQSVEEEMSRYLSDMGVTSTVLALMAETPATSIHWMTMPELGATHIATDFRGASALMASDTARPSPPISAVVSLDSDSLTGEQLDANRPDSDRLMTRASGTVPLGQLENDAAMDVVFSHQSGEPTVSVSLKEAAGRGGRWTRDLVASIELSDGQIFKVLNPDTGPAAPLVATIPVAAMCSLGTDGFVKLDLNTSGAMRSSEMVAQVLIANVRHLNGMDELVSEACTGPTGP
jgi:hypothetical protein